MNFNYFCAYYVVCFCICYFYFLAGPELLGVGSLLKKYTALLCTHIGDILPVATSIASTTHRHFAEVSRVVDGDLTGSDFVLYRPYCQFSDNSEKNVNLLVCMQVTLLVFVEHFVFS